MQHLDIPINNYDNDKPNFKPFAKKVATSIFNYNQDETLIFSIEGRWGSGKTSLINLIENEIKNEIEILHFNPWLLTDINQVIKLFFDELIKILSYGSFKVKLNEKLNIKDETKEQIFQHLKSRLEKLTLDNFLNDEKIEIYIFSRYDKFDLTLDKIANELNNYIFQTSDNFFNVINKFKYWQMSSDGNRWLIAKDSLKRLTNLEEIENYISDLKKKDLIDNKKELLEIWNRETRW